MNTKQYHLHNLDCEHCAGKIEERIQDVDKNSHAHVDYSSRVLEVDGDRLSQEELEKIIKAIVPGVHMHPIGHYIQEDYYLSHGPECWDNFQWEGHMCGHCAEEIQEELSLLEGVEEANLDILRGKISLHAHHKYSLEEIEQIVQKHEPHVKLYQQDLPHLWEVYILENLGCQNCALKIQEEVEKLQGVEEVEMDFLNQRLRIRSKRKLTAQEIEQIAQRHEKEIHVRRQGMENKKAKFTKEMRRELVRLMVAGGIFALSYILDGYFRLILMGLAYLLVGYPVLLQAGKNILSGSIFDENFLMTLATFGAIALGNYPEAVGVMLFYSMGEFFEALAVNRSRESIKGLLDIRPQTAHLQTKEGIVEVAPQDVPKGANILVKPGEMIPLDGLIIKGKSSIDLRDITGEAIPKDVEEKDMVPSGSINLSGSLSIETTVPYRDTTVAKIMDLMENSRREKSPTEKFITRFARVYTPIVVIGALILAFAPSLFFGQPLAKWVERSLIFLIISCPCALVTSVPLSFFGGMGAASKKGILMKGSTYVESLEKVKVALFDKTGTLTKGKFYVKEVRTEAIEKEALLKLAAIGESHSNHPIAISIVSAYGKAPEPDNLKEFPGKGVEFTYQGKSYLLGNERFLEERNILVSKEKTHGTVVHLAGEKWLGSILLEDEMKEDSKESIAKLKALGIRCVMLTGDSKDRAEEVAKAVGIEDYQASMLPEEKLHVVKAWQEKGTTAFLGDGTNDAPSMVQADVGIAMGGVGSDVSLEAADVVFMTDELSKLPQAIRMAKKIKAIVMQNMIFALGIKVLFLALGALGVANIWEAVFADVGVMVLAVLNSMRTMHVE